MFQAFGDIFSNVLDIRNERGWEELQDVNPSMGSEQLLDNAEDFGLLVASSLNDGQQLDISRSNIGNYINLYSKPVFDHPIWQ